MPPQEADFVSVAAIDRLIEVLQLRDAGHPDQAIQTAISDLRAIREVLLLCTIPACQDGEIAARIFGMLDEISMLERSSLGTATARRVRADAEPAHVADILLRHHELSSGTARRYEGRHVLPAGLTRP